MPHALPIALALLGQPADLSTRISTLEAAKPLVELTTIGTSRQGRPIALVWVTDTSDTGVAPADRPTIVIVGGIDGRHRIGVDAAMGVAERLVSGHRDLLKTVRFAIIPCLNVDNHAWQGDGVHPRMDFGRTLAPHDADGDRRINEDPGEDLNGDGVVTMMRVRNPPASSGLRAEYCADPDFPRLLVKADPDKGQRAEYALLIEGIDNDGDGKFNEDGMGGSGGGGVDLNANFPYRWPEFADGAGLYPLSEPESLAFAQWFIDQRNVVAVVAYAPGDTIVTLPQAGKFDATGQLTLGIEEADKAAYEDISQLFKDSTRMTGAPPLELAGSLTGWVYAHQGVLSLSTPVWVRPDLVKPAEGKQDEGKGDEQGRKDKQTDKKPKTEEAKWLVYADEQSAAGGSKGFVDWSAFRHPQIGEVEIGGFVPGLRQNPPAEVIARLVDEQTAFVAALASRAPRLVAGAPEVERLGPGLYRVSVRVTNEGKLASMPRINTKARHGLPTLLTIDVPLDRLVAGEKIAREWVIPGSGGVMEAQWLVRGDEGTSVDVVFRPSIGPRSVLRVELKEAAK